MSRGNYKGGTHLGSGLLPAGEFPLIHAKDIQVGDTAEETLDKFLEDAEACAHTWSELSEFSKLLPAEQCVSKTVDYCTLCSMMRMKQVESHSFEQYGGKSATCTTQGYLLMRCSVCGIETDTPIAALGHLLSTVPAQAPTLTSIGWNEYKKCTRSGCTYTEGYEELPATGYAVTYDLTGCTLSAGSSVIGADGMIVTLVANYGYTFSELSVTRVQGCSYSITSQTDDTITLSLTKPTGDVTIKVMAQLTYGSTGGAVTIPFTVASSYANYYSISSQTPATITAPDGFIIDDITIGSMSCDHSSLSISGVTAVATIADDAKSATISLSGNTQGTTGGSNSATMTVNYTMKYSASEASTYDFTLDIAKDGVTAVATCTNTHTTIDAGETITLTVKAATGYNIYCLVSNAEHTWEETAVSGKYSLTVFNPTGDVTVNINGFAS